MNKLYIAITILVILVIIGVSSMIFFRGGKEKIINSLTEGVGKSIHVSTTAFEDGGMIPRKYTCDGEDISPEIGWKNIPEGTKSIMILMYDPDAPGGYFIHWVIYNIPAHVTELPEGESGRNKRSTIGIEAINDFGRVGYGGPCPPPGKPHRYYFIVFALDSYLNIGKNVRALDVLKAAKGHILAYGEIMGKYGR